MPKATLSPSPALPSARTRTEITMSGTPDPRGFLPAFVTLNALAGTSVGLAKVATSLYSLQLRPSQFELSLIAAAQSVGVLAMSLPLGVLLDQFGPLRLFVTGSA